MCGVRHTGPKAAGLPVVRSHVRLEGKWARHHDAAAACGDPWLVIHLEPMTQLPGDKDAGGAVRPEPGAGGSDRKLISG